MNLTHATPKKPVKGFFFPQSERVLRHEDDFAKGEFEDPYHLARRRNTLIVSLARTAPQDTCFCTSFGGGPFDRTGSDILLVEVGESLLLEACSESGAALLEEPSEHPVEPTEESEVPSEDPSP